MTNKLTLAPWVYHDVLPCKSHFIVIHGGRGSGKSEGLAQVMLIKSMSEKGIRIVCGREIQKSIKESSYAYILRWIEAWGLQKYYAITNTSIVNKYTKSVFLFHGLSDVTKNQFTSISNIKYLWIDEAHTITELTWERIVPSIRARDAQIYISLNPHNENDVIYHEFITTKRDDAFVRRVNYDENPWFANSILDKLRYNDMKYKPSWLYNHIWNGELRLCKGKSLIDISRIRRYDTTQPIQYDRVVISLDTAYTTKEHSDYTVIGCFGKVGTDVHVLSIVRKRLDFVDLKSEFTAFYLRMQSKYGNIYNVVIENKASGISLIQELERHSTLSITKVTPTKDKYTRVVEVLETIHRDLWVPMYSIESQGLGWVPLYLHELSEFTADGAHEHDDQIDCTVMAVNLLRYNASIDWERYQAALDNYREEGEEIAN